MDSLPVEMIQHISSFLYENDLSSFACVNQYIHYCVNLNHQNLLYLMHRTPILIHIFDNYSRFIYRFKTCLPSCYITVSFEEMTRLLSIDGRYNMYGQDSKGTYWIISDQIINDLRPCIKQEKSKTPSFF